MAKIRFKHIFFALISTAAFLTFSATLLVVLYYERLIPIEANLKNMSPPFVIFFTMLVIILLLGVAIVASFLIRYKRQLIPGSAVLKEGNRQLVELLKVYKAYDQNGPLKLVRHGRPYDGGYVVPVKAFEVADVLLGYGIFNDNSFEDEFSLIYNKPSYGFDGGISGISSKSPLFTFVDECIGSDRFLRTYESSSGKVSTFSQQINNLGLKDKKVFIKMDIEGAEYDAFEDILSKHDVIAGMALEMHFEEHGMALRATKLLESLNKNFILLHVHGNNLCGGRFSTSNSVGVIPEALELTYINKTLVSDYHLSKNQKHPLFIDMKNCRFFPDLKFEVLL